MALCREVERLIWQLGALSLFYTRLARTTHNIDRDESTAATAPSPSTELSKNLLRRMRNRYALLLKSRYPHGSFLRPLRSNSLACGPTQHAFTQSNSLTIAEENARNKFFATVEPDRLLTRPTSGVSGLKELPGENVIESTKPWGTRFHWQIARLRSFVATRDLAPVNPPRFPHEISPVKPQR